MTLYYTTDIHGQYEALVSLFSHVVFSPEIDKLVVGGDLIDHGPNAAKVVQLLKQLQESYPENVVVLSGNHEAMMRDYVFEAKSAAWLTAGEETRKNFNEVFDDEQERDAHLEWLAYRPMLHETEDFVFVHAGLDPFYSLDAQPESAALWMDRDELVQYTKKDYALLLRGRILVHGHHPVRRVKCNGFRINGDLGASILPDDSLALLDLSRMRVHQYSIDQNTITTVPIDKPIGG